MLDSVEFDGQPWNDARYEFAYEGSKLYGGSFVDAGRYAVDDVVQVGAGRLCGVGEPADQVDHHDGGPTARAQPARQSPAGVTLARLGEPGRGTHSGSGVASSFGNRNAGHSPGAERIISL